MKALLISSDKDLFNRLQQLFQYSGRPLKLSYLEDRHQLMAIAKLDGPWGFFILDDKMNPADSAQILNELMAVTGARPVLYLAEQEKFQQLQSQLLYLSGSNCHCPGIESELLPNLLDQLMHTNQRPENYNDAEWVHIPVQDFRLFDSFPFPLWLRLEDGKMQRVSDLLSITDQSELFLFKDELPYFLDHTVKAEMALFKKKNVKGPNRLKGQLRSLGVLHLWLRHRPVNGLLQEFSSELVDSILTVANKMKSIKQLLQSLPAEYRNSVCQCLVAAYCASIICQESGAEDFLSRKIVCAILVADSFQSDQQLYLAESLNDSCFAQTSEEQIQKFLAHPQNAARLAPHFAQFGDLTKLIEMHHEMPSRLGFPKRPLATEFGPNASVVCLSFIFAREWDKNQGDVDKAIARIAAAFNLGDFKLPFKALQQHLRYA